MKYISYLQNGGNIVQALIEKVVQSQGQDQSAIQQLVQLAEEGNEEAVAFLQELQGQSPAMKCGGRVKKKQLGEKIVKAKKASCGCQLKKVGGRLIEVDGCTGLPVHRTGAAIKKYQDAPGAITRNGNVYTYGDSSFTRSSDGGWTQLGGHPYSGASSAKFSSGVTSYTPVTDASLLNQLNTAYNNAGYITAGEDEMRGNSDYVIGGHNKFARNKYYRWNNGNLQYVNTNLFNDGVDGQWQNVEGGIDSIEDAELKKLIQSKYQPAKPTVSSNVGEGPAQPVITPGQRNAAAVGMLSADGKTGMNVAERRAWMEGAGKDYLASLNGGNGLGFSAADYTGTAAQNRALFNAYKGFGAWQSAQPQVQPEAQPEVQPTVYTNQQLLGMTDEQAAAAGLSAGDIARRTKLNDYQTARNTALTFNGQQYADETAYNAAVDAYNQNLTNKYTTDRTSAYDKYMANRTLATTAGTQGITARRQAAFDNLAKLNNGTLKYSDLSRRDIRDMQRQYRRGKDAGYYTAATAKDFYANQNGVAKPELAQKFNGNSVLTDEQLNATSFKQGGQLNYADYLN